MQKRLTEGIKKKLTQSGEILRDEEKLPESIENHCAHLYKIT